MKRGSIRSLAVAEVQAALDEIAEDLGGNEKRLRELYLSLPRPTNEAMLAGEIAYDLKTELKLALCEILGQLRQVIRQAKTQSQTTEQSAAIPWWRRKRARGRGRPLKKTARQGHA